MKPKATAQTILALAVLLAVTSALGCQAKEGRKKAEAVVEAKVTQAAAKIEPQGADRDFPEREEIRGSYPLAPGAQVSILGINGSVDVETAEIETAEVHIVRSARQREDLEYRQVKIGHSPDSLIIKVENQRNRSVFFSLFGSTPEGRQRVMLKLPRRVELTTSGINGYVAVGEIDGAIKVKGVNGRVKVARALGTASFAGINGPVEVTLAKLGESGVRVSGVNGPVELRFADELDADLRVNGVNGGVDTDVPNVVVQGKDRSNFRAQIGAGGAPIIVSGLNGRLRLSHETAGSATPIAAERSMR
jgi:hypothetical protein